ncbi:MAG: glycosyltransferase [Firmicutes bacterium]|nr:glycosyltransferase [Bacillota bacterium]
MENTISIIIPTFNEEKTISDTISHVKALKGDKEIIVVDGGSEDSTLTLAEKEADIVFKTTSGRGHQLNEGAYAAGGDILFFLHCDSRLEKDALSAIKDVLSDKGLIGGCFSLKIADDSLPLRFISWTSNLRSRFLKIIFGDQGIFIRKDIFFRLGGFPEIELMEDWEFSRKMASKGELAFLSNKIYTSARRWYSFGIWRTILLMQKIKLLYLLGVKPEKLNQIYRNPR